MTETFGSLGALAARPRALSKRLNQRGRHLGMMALVTVSFLVGLSVGPLQSVERGSSRYWLLIIPAALLPLLDAPSIARTLMGPAKLLLLFLVVAGTWHLFGGDQRAVLQLGLLVLVLTWISSDRALLNVNDLVWLYVALVTIGIAVKVLTDLNPYGLIPGQANEDFGSLRVSFFPNIANTGLLSLAIVLVLTKEPSIARAHPIALAMAFYFLVFSFLRSAFVAAMLYFSLRWWFERRRSLGPESMFWTTIVVALGCNIAIAYSAGILHYAQQWPLVSTFLLKGETNLTIDQIEYQQYRPWLWNEQFKLFANSPWLMGMGSYDFYQVISEQLEDPDARIISTGSEALPTRLLTAYGIPGALFTLYLVVRLRELARQNDRWACACFPALFMLLMNWGNVFHPASALFVLFLLIMTRGSKGFAAT